MPRNNVDNAAMAIQPPAAAERRRQCFETLAAGACSKQVMMFMSASTHGAE